MDISILNRCKDRLEMALSTLDIPSMAENIFKVASLNCGNNVIVAVGKSLLVGQKLRDTLNLMGYRALAFNPLDLLHGGLGAVSRHDNLIIISNSGETKELIDMLHTLEDNGFTFNNTIVITQYNNSTLALDADYTIAYGDVLEACPFNLIPSTSILIQSLVCDMIAFAMMENDIERNDWDEDHTGRANMRTMILANHPSGQLKERN